MYRRTPNQKEKEMWEMVFILEWQKYLSSELTGSSFEKFEMQPTLLWADNTVQKQDNKYKK